MSLKEFKGPFICQKFSILKLFLFNYQVIPESSSLADIPNIPFTPKALFSAQEEDVNTLQGDFFEEITSVHETSTVMPDQITTESQSFKMSNFSTFSKGIASGFSNFMTSFDAKTGTDENLDNMSVRSDGSSDSERFIVVNLEQQNRADILNAMFVVPASKNPQQALIDEASDVLEEHEKSQHSEYSIKRSDPVIVLCYLLYRLLIVCILIADQHRDDQIKQG
jgi:hypothetical protein